MREYTRFKEYIWLINTINNANGITLKDLNKKWQASYMSEGEPLHRNTFLRHRNAIEDIFGLNIECNGFNEYYIENAKVLKEDSVQRWILSTLSVSNVISESKSIHDRILLESIPSQGSNLETLIDAMKSNVCARIKYKKYQTAEPAPRLIEPYCIKLFKLRWYVLGRLHDEKLAEGDSGLRNFSLDRVVDADKTDIPFVIDPKFSAEEYYSKNFGVFIDENTKVERVVLRALKYEPSYLKDLPAHPTQKLIKQGEDYADFEYHLRPTNDFCNFILGRGCFLKVLSPQWLADRVRDMITNTLKLYNP